MQSSKDLIGMNQDSNCEMNFMTKEFWNDILNVSVHQSKINSNVILQTVKFMIQEIDELDPKLISFVSSLIDKPSTQPRNLKDPKKKDFSQYGQSPYMDKLLGEIKNGFVVEAGAYDGEHLSNSLFFELERNWSGILIEPLPFLYESILSKKRKMYSINACIAKNKPIVAKFKISNKPWLSGRESEMSKKHHNRVGSDYNYIYVPCFSLNTILKAINVTRVDLFSLDLEGGEWDVLSNLDLIKINYMSFVIEHNGEVVRRDKMINFLTNKNYKLTKTDGQDIFLLKN